MSKRNRRARLIIAVFAVAFAGVVAFQFRSRPADGVAVPVARTDLKAVVESTGGHLMRFKREHEDVSVEYDRQLTYADGSTRLLGVKVSTDERGGGRAFTVTGKEGQVGQNESVVALNGDVKLVASDGFTAKTEHATYNDSEGLVRAPGPVEFAHDRMSGSGVGMTYDKNSDVLSILDQAVLHMAPDRNGGAAAEVASSAATFVRREKNVRFERGLKVQRAGQVIEADAGVAYLTPDEKRIDRLELHGNSRIAGANIGAGGLQRMTGRDVTLQYGSDGQALQHALVDGDAVIQLAGDTKRPGPQITANTVDIGLAPDGSTPTAVVGRGAVTLTFPAEQAGVARTIRAATLDAKGEPGRGLTNAQFNGKVQYRERGGSIDRAVSSGALDVALKPGLSAIEEARFAHAVRFEEGKMATLSAASRYDLDKGLIELTGAEPGVAAPHVVNEQISVDATRIDVTLDGPKIRAVGNVKSVLQPPKKGAQNDDARLPSLLKQDQPVNVTGDDLNYDGAASRAAYTGKAQLWQGDTSVRADTLVLDSKTGDLNATGSVATSVMLEQVDKDKNKERVRSIATAKDFKYEESVRRATYSGDAHLSGPQGDLTAATIELYLTPRGEELDRAEASDSVTLREQNRKTVGSHMTYTAADERYVVTGAPVSIVDRCDRETIGKTLTFVKATDTIDVDGNERIRTQTKGGGKCP